MGGFGVVVGFMFSFFTILFIFSAAFYSYNQNLIEQTEIIHSYDGLSEILRDVDYTLKNPFFSSGRFNFQLENLDSEKLFFIDNRNQNCFNFFSNNKFISKDDFNINILKNTWNNYKYIDINSYGILSFIESNIVNDYSFKTISCNGVSRTVNINSSNIDWWDSLWHERKKINISNVANFSMRDYQVELNLNSSILDFSKFRENELRFLLPLKENFVLDLPFDKYNQEVNDFSKYSNLIYLGSTNSTEVADPSLEENGVLFNSLNFDGIDDYITIGADKSLEIKDKISIVSFIKWDGEGDNFQNIFTNGAWNNALRIVNDGGVHDRDLLFQLSISGTTNYLYSNVSIDDNDWHFIVATYDGEMMKLYLDNICVGNLSILGEIDVFSNDNYVGSEGTGFFFNGSIDELKLLNVVLKEDEILDLSHNNLRFRELDYYLSDFDVSSNEALVYVKIPFVPGNNNLSFYLYYDNREDDIVSNSDIEKTFSYDVALKVGYVLSDRISSSTGLNIFSLYDDNFISVGDDNFSLDEQEGTTLDVANIEFNDSVKMKFLSQVEGNGNSDDIITPISWASTNFYYRGFRTGTDRFCMISPWGVSSTKIYDAGVLEWEGLIYSNGTCVNMDIGTNNNLQIISSIPILVSYAAISDSFVFFPATSEDLFGVPSQTLYIATGDSGASVNWYESDGTTYSVTLGVNGSTSKGSNGPDGNSPAFKIVSNNLIGAIQQADGDGSESTVFVPKKEFGVKFGSNEGTDYVAVVSDVSDANCSVYDSLGVLVGNQVNGVGINGVYKYNFGVGNDNLYVGARWKIQCDKPVWPYYENHADNDDETNLFGHLQMKQYIYPEPLIEIN